MTAATSRLRRRGIGAGVAALVGLTSVAGLAGAAQAASGFTFPSSNRVAGADRYATAIAASTTAFPTGTQAGGVVLVSGTSTVDGLTASFVAGSHTAPILLVKNGVIDAATLAEITRLNVTNVWIVGGTTVVPEGVETQLPGKTVVRYGGSDRYATAGAAATANGTVVTQPGKVFIASGTADALAAAPVLYNKKYPLLLTRPGSVPADTTAALAKLTTTSRTVLGGTTAVDATTYSALAGTVRLQGANRFETATAIAASAVANEGFSGANVALANGNDAAAVDSLTGSVVAGKNGVPLIFANGTDTSPAATTAYLTTNNSALTGQLYVFGGTTVVSAAAATAVVTTATTPVSSTITISPTAATALTVADETSTTATSDDRVYTATGLDNALAYRVTLVLTSNITTNANGTVSFVQDGSTGLAAAGALAADITVVNGVPTGADTSAGAVGATTAPTDIQTVGAIAPSNGTISFRVDGQADETVTPVIYVDGGANTRLEIGSTGVPTETFALGGSINFQPTEQVTGTPTPGAITEVDKTNSQLVAGGLLYKYDANDNYYIGIVGEANRVTQAAFLAELSVGDALTAGVYQREPSLSSSFALNDLTPIAITGATISATPTGGTLTVPTANFTAGATLKVYVGTNNDNAFDAATDTLRTTVTTDSDATTAGFQIPLSGLTESTSYDVFVSQTVGGEESVPSAFIDLTTTSSTIATAPVSIATTHGDADLNGLLNTGDSLTITFNEPITAPAGAALTITDDDGTTGTVTNGSGATFTVSGTNNNILTVALTALPTGGGGSAAGVNLLGGNDIISSQTGVVDRGTSPLAWAPSGTLGVRIVPSSTVVGPATLTGAVGNAAGDVVTGSGAVPFATITVTGTGGGLSGTYSVLASSTGTYSVPVTGLTAGNTATVTQTVSGVGTSTASSTITAA